MKKKILGGIAALAIAAVVAFNISLNTKKDNASLLALANVEALAKGEKENKTYGCIYGAVYGGIMPARLCESCVWQFFLAGYSSMSTCTKN